MRIPVASPTVPVAVLAIAAAAVTAPPAAARSSIRVGIADESPAMFTEPNYTALHLKRTRYFVPENVMSDTATRAKARAFVLAARAAGVSTLLHISTSDLRSKKGPVISASRYKRDVTRTVAYFRKLGVKEFGAWNEVNHATEETWNHPELAASYFRSMYSVVKSHCGSCTVVALDVLDQAGVASYIARFYSHLSSTWRRRASIVGIHNYSDVNRSRSSGTSTIIKTVHHYDRGADFWFTETGALASFAGSFPFSESRQASRLKSMFSLATKFHASGVTRVYEYNWTGIDEPGCGSTCLFDAGLVRADGSTRPAYTVFRERIKDFSR